MCIVAITEHNTATQVNPIIASVAAKEEFMPRSILPIRIPANEAPDIIAMLMFVLEDFFVLNFPLFILFLVIRKYVTDDNICKAATSTISQISIYFPTKRIKNIHDCKIILRDSVLNALMAKRQEKDGCEHQRWKV